MCLFGSISHSMLTGSCPGWVSELSGAAKRNPGERQQSRLLPPPHNREFRAAAGLPRRPADQACNAPASRSHLIRFRSCFRARSRCSPVYGGWRVRPCFPTHTKRLATGDRQTDRTCRPSSRVECGRRWSRRGGAVRRAELSLPLPSVLGSLGVAPKAPAQCPAPGGGCPSVDAEGSQAGGGRRLKQKEGRAGSWAAGGAAATLPALPRNPRREEQAAAALGARLAERGGQRGPSGCCPRCCSRPRRSRAEPTAERSVSFGLFFRSVCSQVPGAQGTRQEACA